MSEWNCPNCGCNWGCKCPELAPAEPRPALIAPAVGVTDDEVWQACCDYTDTYDGSPDSDMRPVMRHVLEQFLSARSTK